MNRTFAMDKVVAQTYYQKQNMRQSGNNVGLILDALRRKYEHDMAILKESLAKSVQQPVLAEPEVVEPPVVLAEPEVVESPVILAEPEVVESPVILAEPEVVESHLVHNQQNKHLLKKGNVFSRGKLLH